MLVTLNLQNKNKNVFSIFLLQKIANQTNNQQVKMKINLHCVSNCPQFPSLLKVRQNHKLKLQTVFTAVISRLGIRIQEVHYTQFTASVLVITAVTIIVGHLLEEFKAGTCIKKYLSVWIRAFVLDKVKLCIMFLFPTFQVNSSPIIRGETTMKKEENSATNMGGFMVSLIIIGYRKLRVSTLNITGHMIHFKSLNFKITRSDHEILQALLIIQTGAVHSIHCPVYW